MRVIANERLIKRNAAIGKYANGAAIVILLGGLALSYFRRDFFWIAAIALVVGFGLSQFSFYYINRFGRRPRLDEQVVGSLKGLSNDFALYQYNTPVSHLLVGPGGVWIILPYYQRGTIVYQGGRWRQRRGGFAATYLKIFAQEGLGRPDLDLESEMVGLEDFFSKRLEGEPPAIHAALLFVDKGVDLQVENAPVPTVHPSEMKDLIRRAAKQDPLPTAEMVRIKALLPQPQKPEKKSSGDKS